MHLSAETIATLSGVGVGFVLTAILGEIQERRKERRHKKELLANFKSELIHLYKDNEYNFLHTETMPVLPTIKIRSNALEELIKTDSIPENGYDKIMIIWKRVDDINRAMYYKDDRYARENADVLERQNKVIYDESKALRDDLFELSELNLDGLGKFTRGIFGNK